MGRPSRRPERVAELVHRELSAILQRRVKDPRVGNPTITRVQVSADLRHARVFVRLPGGPGDRARALEGLQSAAGFLRARLGEVVRLRYLPELTFEVDRGLDEARRIDELLRGIHGE